MLHQSLCRHNSESITFPALAFFPSFSFEPVDLWSFLNNFFSFFSSTVRRQHIFYIGQIFVPLHLVIVEIQYIPVEPTVWIAMVHIHEKTLCPSHAQLDSRRKNPVLVAVGLGHVTSCLPHALPETEFSALGHSQPWLHCPAAREALTGWDKGVSVASVLVGVAPVPGEKGEPRGGVVSFSSWLCMARVGRQGLLLTSLLPSLSPVLDWSPGPGPVWKPGRVCLGTAAKEFSLYSVPVCLLSLWCWLGCPQPAFFIVSGQTRDTGLGLYKFLFCPYWLWSQVQGFH